jgi:hypothetical protein
MAGKKPKPQRLPGVDDTAITAIEKAAEEYAEVRDERAELTVQEVKLKGKLHDLMKHHGKRKYQRNGLVVELVVEEETVKVRLPKKGEGDD